MLQPPQLQGCNAGRGTALGGCVAIFPPASAPAPVSSPRARLPLPESKNQLLPLFQPLLGQKIFVTGTGAPPGKKSTRQMEVSHKPLAGPYSAEQRKSPYIYIPGPVSSFFTWFSYWLAHVCFVSEKKTLSALWKLHVKWARAHYLPYWFCLTPWSACRYFVLHKAKIWSHKEFTKNCLQWDLPVLHNHL